MHLAPLPKQLLIPLIIHKLVGIKYKTNCYVCDRQNPGSCILNKNFFGNSLLLLLSPSVPSPRLSYILAL